MDELEENQNSIEEASDDTAVICEETKPKDSTKILKVALIVVLVVFMGIVAVLTNQLTKNVTTINSLLEIVNTTNNELSDMISTASVLSKEISSLSSELDAASSTNAILHENLKSVSSELASTSELLEKYETAYNLHHFYSLEDLDNFLLNDDTEEYVDTENGYELAYRLQARAAQHGYLLTVDYDYTVLVLAVIDDGSVYAINPATDEYQLTGIFTEPISFYPLAE